MTLYVQLTDIYTENAVADSLPFLGDALVVGRDATICSYGTLANAGIMMQASAQAVTVYGAVIGNNGIYATIGGYIRIGDTGTVTGTGSSTSSAIVKNYGPLATISLNNAGYISGYIGIYLADGGSGDTVFNSGKIIGQGFGIIGYANEYINNTGAIEGSLYSLSLNNGVDRVVNSGVLRGDVYLGNGDDVFDSTGGQVFGRIDAGDGNDRVIGGLSNDTIVAGLGDDTIDGGVGLDTLDFSNQTLGAVRVNLTNGTAWNRQLGLDLVEGVERVIGTINADRIVGSSAAETLSGGIGNDILLGRAGDDRLVGGESDDTLDGGSGNDRLLGGTGIDTLIGGTGDDLLLGGADVDRLTGGFGNDTFLFRDFSDFRTGFAVQTDRITDFVRGLDLIDLGGVDADVVAAGDQDFGFIGSASFTGSGQVRVVAGVSDTVIYACTDFATAPAGSAILTLTGVIALTASDFNL